MRTIHIILVHGTFGRGSDWIKSGSVIRTHLKNNLLENVQFHVFKWSGLPSYVARHRASTELAHYIEALPETAGHCIYFIIAHSHGGNIAMYAMRRPQVCRKICGLIALSTPFLISRPREYSALSKAGLKAASVSLFFCALYFIFDTCNALAHFYFAAPKNYCIDHIWIFWPMLAVFLAIIFKGSNLISSCVKWFEQNLSIPRLDRAQLLRRPDLRVLVIHATVTGRNGGDFARDA